MCRSLFYQIRYGNPLFPQCSIVSEISQLRFLSGRFSAYIRLVVYPLHGWHMVKNRVSICLYTSFNDPIPKCILSLDSIRKQYSQISPRVKYYLSEVGKEFLPVLDSIRDFGSKYIGYLGKYN